jgi:hypothetical protein
MPRFPAILRWILGAALLGWAACSESGPDAAAGASDAVAGPALAGPKAAIAYRAAQAQLDENLIETISSADRFDALDETARAVLQRRQTAVTAIIEASRIEQCDVGTDSSQGIATVMRVAANIRLGRHSASDRAIVAKLVGFSIVPVATNLIAELHQRRMLSPGRRQRLLDELRTIDRNDPLGALVAQAESGVKEEISRMVMPKASAYRRLAGELTTALDESIALLEK